MSAPEFERVLLAHQRIPMYDGTQGQRCVGCDDLRGETDGPNSPRHAAHLSAALHAEVARWLADEGTVDVVWDVLDGHGHNGLDCRPRAGFDLSIRAALAALTTTDPTANGAS